MNNIWTIKMEFLSNYPDYQTDIDNMECVRRNLLESLPWPNYARSSFDNLPSIVPVWDGTNSSYSYIAFDAEDSAHPFSNAFVAPFPIKKSLVQAVDNINFFVRAGTLHTAYISKQKYIQLCCSCKRDSAAHDAIHSMLIESVSSSPSVLLERLRICATMAAEFRKKAKCCWPLYSTRYPKRLTT